MKKTRREKDTGPRHDAPLTAWDIEPPVPAMFDIRISRMLSELHSGNPELLARETENGGLEYALRFMTPEDTARLARTICTGSPLTQAERRKTRQAERQRDIEIITRICYWKAQGLPLYSHHSTDTAIHRAAGDYSTKPTPGAPARTPESIRKHVWAPMQKEGHPLPLKAAEQAVLLFIDGLRSAGGSAEENTTRFAWLGRHVLKFNRQVCLNAAHLAELDSLLDLTNEECRTFRSFIGEQRRRRTYINRPPTSGQE